MITIKKFDLEFQKWATDHKQIQSYGFGDYFKIQTDLDRRYPCMWVTPMPSTLNLTQLNSRFQVLFCDILDPEYNNLVEILSDTQLLCIDFISEFSNVYGDNNFSAYIDEANVLITPTEFTRLENEVAGYVVDVSFINEAPLNPCTIPIK